MSKSNIIKFPKVGRVNLERPPTPPPKQTANAESKSLKPADDKGGFSAAVIRWVWVAVVLCWSLVKWIVSIDVFFQFGRMIYYWDDPEIHSTLTFIIHFSVLVALTYFVSVFKPKGI